MPDPQSIDWSKVPGMEHLAAQGGATSGGDQIDWSKVPGMEHLAGQPKQPGLFEQLGGWGGLGALATRAGTGILSSVVGAVPSPVTTPLAGAISGAGEAAAEKLSGQPYDPAAIGVESVAGAIPLGKIIEGGRLGLSALRSGLLGGGKEALSEYTHGGVSALDPTKILGAGGFGALGGLLGAKLTPVSAETAATAKAAAPGKFEVTPTSQTAWGGQPRVISGKNVVTAAADTRTPEELAADATRYQEKTPILGAFAPSGSVAKAADKAAIQAAKQRAEQAVQRRAEQEILQRGWEEKTPSISEAATGKLSMRIPYGPPEEDEQAIAKSAAQTLGASPAQAVPTPPPAPAPVPGPEVPPVAEPQSSLAQFFKTPGGAAGANYRAAQEAAAAGEIPSAQAARGSRLLTVPGREAEGLSELKQAFTPKAAPELAEGGAPKLPAETPVAAGGPEAPAPSTTGTVTSRPMTEAETAQQQWIVDEASKLSPEDKAAFVARLRSESGQVSPAVLQHLGLIGGGAALGGGVGYLSDEDDPATSAVRGAVLGGLTGAWVAPGPGQELTLGTLGRNLLDLHRASLLTAASPQEKKVVGDVGGLLMEGIKQQLPGPYGSSEVGRNIVRNTLTAPFRPQTYKTYYSALMDALRGGASTEGIRGAIGDISAENRRSALGWVGAPFTAAKAVTGDILERSGEYNPEVLSQITGTNTPESKAGREFLGFIQRNPWTQWLVPFSKVPVNIAEGVRNLPGVAQALGKPDATQASLMSAGQMGLGALEQLYNQAQEEAGEPVDPKMKALQSTAMGIKGVAPNVIGKVLASAATGGGTDAVKELLRLIPTGQPPPPPFPNESINSYMRRLANSAVTEIAPGFLSPETGTVR